MKALKKIPKFSAFEQEVNFWQTSDSTDYVDWSKAKKVYFPNLKPSTKSISLRLPETLLENIKTLANKEDIPYQSLIKFLLAQGARRLHQHQSV
jgi:predicted DNA binding CopG/RHH family protein